jgi:beta-galactosidase/beta-glucuronidase
MATPDGRATSITRRHFFALGAGAASVVASRAAAQSRSEPQSSQNPTVAGQGGLLYPRQSQVRNVVDLSGLWEFQLDPSEEGEARRWFDVLPSPRPIAVPCSWNDLYDDARDYLGLAWYRHEVYVPGGWRGQRVFLRIGSANYVAKVWLNGTLVTEHLGGHLPFATDVTDRLAWERKNVIAIAVENKQLPERVPPGPAGGGGGVFGTMAPFPATTYDFFPYAGLHRPVVLYSSSPSPWYLPFVESLAKKKPGSGGVSLDLATFPWRAPLEP